MTKKTPSFDKSVLADITKAVVGCFEKSKAYCESKGIPPFLAGLSVFTVAFILVKYGFLFTIALSVAGYFVARYAFNLGVKEAL